MPPRPESADLEGEAERQVPRVYRFQRHVPAAAFALLVVLAAALRFHGLSRPSLWWDEGLSLAAARPNLSGIVHAAIHTDFHPPEYYLLLHLWMEGFGSSPADIRLLSALAGIAGVAITYFLGRCLFGVRVGLIAGSLVAISQFHLYYSQEARSYAFLYAASVAATHGYWLLFHTPGLRRVKAMYYVAASTLLLYVHFAGIFVVIAHGIHRIAVMRKQPDGHALRLWLMTQGVLAIAFLPWLLAMFEQASRLQRDFWIPVPTFYDSLQASPDYSVMGTLRQFTGYGVRGVLMVLLVANAFFGARLARLQISSQSDGGASETQVPRRGLLATISQLNSPPRAADSSWSGKYELLAIWILCSILLPYLQSLVSQPIYVSRLAIPALAPLLLLAADGIARFRSAVFQGAVLALVVLLAAPGLHAYFSTEFKERWDLATAAVEGGADPGDIVLIAGGALETWKTYAHRSDLALIMSEHAAEYQAPVNASADIWTVTRQGAPCLDEGSNTQFFGGNWTHVSCQRITPSTLRDFHSATNSLYVRHFVTA